ILLNPLFNLIHIPAEYMTVVSFIVAFTFVNLFKVWFVNFHLRTSAFHMLKKRTLIFSERYIFLEEIRNHLICPLMVVHVHSYDLWVSKIYRQKMHTLKKN